ncbi:hypothetical protein PAXINDRAFT_93337 [Paxillus involutus ATCC 200175]|uniref:Uncharacterized protein n=1 Tax=Paxillus involutus ATCC 200175 TaxID=664439 RepID=A0A0C9TBF8_PAXIN|nr:hypothetical protein PAXINDRAFT_93337 [Paxillus involutus ATCC 200175]
MRCLQNHRALNKSGISSHSQSPVWSCVGSCTLQTTRYSLLKVLIDSNVYHLCDTVGPDEPQLAKRTFLDAIMKAYKLVGSLGRGGGIHFLVFCMGGGPGRLLATAQSNYHLFYEFLCQGRVPVVPTITHLEDKSVIDEWWTRKEQELKNFGMWSTGHACVTAIQGLGKHMPRDTMNRGRS